MAQGTDETHWGMEIQSPQRTPPPEPHRTGLLAGEGETQSRKRGLDGRKDADLSNFGNEQGL